MTYLYSMRVQAHLPCPGYWTDGYTALSVTQNQRDVTPKRWSPIYAQTTETLNKRHWHCSLASTHFLKGSIVNQINDYDNDDIVSYQWGQYIPFRIAKATCYFTSIQQCQRIKNIDIKPAIIHILNTISSHRLHAHSSWYRLLLQTSQILWYMCLSDCWANQWAQQKRVKWSKCCLGTHWHEQKEPYIRWRVHTDGTWRI